MEKAEFLRRADQPLREHRAAVQSLGHRAPPSGRNGPRSMRSESWPTTPRWITCSSSDAPVRSIPGTARRSRWPWPRSSIRAGLSWGILGTREKCCGDPLRRLGNEYVFRHAGPREHRTLQTTRRPAGHHLLPALLQHPEERLRAVRGRLRGDPPHAAHCRLLLEQGRITLSGRAWTARIVFHDSCYLGRYNGMLQRAPRGDHQRPHRRQAAAGDAPMPRRTASAAARAAAGCGWTETSAGASILSGRRRPCPESLNHRRGLPLLHDHVRGRPARRKRQDQVKVKDVAEIVVEAM